MGFTKFDTERDELTRERSNTRIARGRDRRQARSRKHASFPPALAIEPDTRAAAIQTVPWQANGRDEPTMHAPHQAMPAPPSDTPPMMPVKEGEADGVASPIEPRVSRRELDIAEVHGRPAPAAPDIQSDTPPVMPVKVVQAEGIASPGETRVSRREREIAQFRERREQVVRQARAEAATRIARDGTLATVSDALAAIRDPQAGCWATEREQLDQALAAGPREAAAAARHALRQVSRDAARTTRHARHDPDLAFAVCVAYATVVRLARTAVRIHQRDAHPTQSGVSRPFWH